MSTPSEPTIVLHKDVSNIYASEEISEDFFGYIPDFRYRRHAPETFAQWIALSILLASFASVINNIRGTNGKGQEPKIATYMTVLAIAILIAFSPIYFVQRWNRPNLVMNVFVLILIILLVILYVWLICRIWITF